MAVTCIVIGLCRGDEDVLNSQLLLVGPSLLSFRRIGKIITGQQ
jgi:hypothetical protein